jgi:Right handed beta helix region
VEPGVYEEDVFLDLGSGGSDRVSIVCPAGPDGTRLRSLSSGAGRTPVDVVGLQIDGLVTTSQDGTPLHWQGCRFMDEVSCPGLIGGGQAFGDCEFRDRLGVSGEGAIDRCRFTGGRAALELVFAHLDVRDCVFESCADTALLVAPLDQVYMNIERCTFRAVDWAIVVNPDKTYYRDGIRVTESRFEDVRHEAISYDQHSQWELSTFFVDVQRSRFTRCGAGVRVDGKGRIDLTMVADTLEDTGQLAVNAAANLNWRLDSLLVRRGSAGAIALHERTALEGCTRSIHASTIEDNAGDGIAVQSDFQDSPTNLRVVGNRILRNAGAGIRAGGGSTVLENLLVENGDGVRLTSSTATNDSVVRNSVVGSGGAGVLIAAPQGAAPVVYVENNLAAQSLGIGIALQGSVGGTARHNDSWRSHVTDYQGVSLDGNLQVDPLFCGPSTLDYQVASNSPCAPSGAYGQIGALGTGCQPQVLAVDPRVVSGVTIGNVAPNPLVSGREITVSFSLPQPASATMDVLDAGGRRVAGQALAASGAGSHQVKLHVDDLPPGIYWLRVAQAGRAASSKIAILP